MKHLILKLLGLQELQKVERWEMIREIEFLALAERFKIKEWMLRRHDFIVFGNVAYYCSIFARKWHWFNVPAFKRFCDSDGIVGFHFARW